MKFCPWAHGQNVDLATKPVQNVLRRVFCLAAAATALASSVETCRKEVSLPTSPLSQASKTKKKNQIKKPSHICKTKKMRDRKVVSLIVRIFL